MTLLSIEHISRSVETGFIRKQKKKYFMISLLCREKGNGGHYRGKRRREIHAGESHHGSAS